MNVLAGDRLADRLEGLLHADTQVRPGGVDLTVARVAELTLSGALDFGGSELEAADVQWLEAVKRDPEDDYGWWDLRAGDYLVEYNERLEPEEAELAMLHPLPRLLAAGASHATLSVSAGDDWPRVLLTVGRAGCRLKENCRISRLILLRAE